MIPFELTILGAGSALPSMHRSATSQYLHYKNFNILIDCAEGTQLRLQELKVSAMKLDAILISHLHGDHYFGLIGLINSMHLNGRINALKIFGPPQLINIIQMMLQASDTKLRFELLFYPLQEKGLQCIYEDENLTINAFSVVHRIPTWGFLIREKQGCRKLDPVFVEAFKPDIAQMLAINQGADFVDQQGRSHANEQITLPSAPSRSYAYCTDTAYTESIIPHVNGVSLLYHEATFMENMADKANLTYHSTSKQAATIAKKAEVGKLLLGHFSSRYANLQPLLMEAKAVFENTELALDGKKVVIE